MTSAPTPGTMQVDSAARNHRLDQKADHLRGSFGSWRRVVEDGNRPFSYREMAPELADYVKGMGFCTSSLCRLSTVWGSWEVSGYRFLCTDTFWHA